MTSRLSLRLAGSVVVALTLAACVEDVDPDVAAMQPGAGSGGMPSTGSAGSGAGAGPGNNMAGGGGSGGVQSDPSFGMGTRCPAPAQALLTDFSPPAPAAVADAGADAGTDASVPVAGPATGASFGDYTNTFSGATFVFPGEGMYPLTSDAGGGNWHVTGSIGDYSGLGIVFQVIPPGATDATNCYVDASMYTGISFTVSGSVPMGNTVTLSLGTAANNVSHVWLNANTNPATPELPNAGRCIPAATQYDNTCASPSFAVPVTAEPTVVNVTWAQLIGGSPAATVDPTELTGIAWSLPAPGGVGTSTPITYAVDITIDNLRFLGP